MGPAIEAMLTMRPAFRSMKYGVIALQVRKTDFVLTVKVRSQSSSLLFVNGMPGGPAAPALLTRMSILPNVSRVRSTIVLTSAALVTSVFMARTLRPSPLTSPATFSAFSTWMSGIATSAPSRAIASTMPRPIPLPPPVTTATLPSSRMKSPAIYSRCPGSTHDSTPAQKPQLVRAERPRRILPLTLNLRPSGKYLMGRLLLRGRPPRGAQGAAAASARRGADEDVIRPLAIPPAGEGGTVSLFGNLSPDGAVLKQSGPPRRICSGIAAAPSSSRTTRISTVVSMTRASRSTKASSRSGPGSAGHVRVRRGAIPRAQTGKKNSSPLIKELPLSSGIFSFWTSFTTIISVTYRPIIGWHPRCLDEGHGQDKGERILEEQHLLAYRRRDRPPLRLAALRAQARACPDSRPLLPSKLLKRHP